MNCLTNIVSVALISLDHTHHFLKALFCTTQGCIPNPPGYSTGTGSLWSLGQILTGSPGRLGLIHYIFAIAALILIFMIISSGYTLLTSAGNPEAMEKAKKRLTAALTGFLIVISAFWIFQLVGLLFDTSFAP